MIKNTIKWLAKLFGISLEPPFKIVDNLDVFVKDKVNLMLEGAKSFDIATGYFLISGWEAFADSVDSLLEKGGKVRLLIGDVSKEYLLPQTETARFLLHLIKNPQIEARTIKPSLLHAKVFMAKTEDKLRLLFGSSNVTFGGMMANIELNTYEVLDLESEKAKSFMEWYEKLWESAVPIDEELDVELTLAGQKEEPVPFCMEDSNKALYLSLLVKDLARIDLRDIVNFAPFKFQYIDVVAGVNRFFFQPWDKRGLMLAHEVGLGKTVISGMILKYLLYHNHIKNALIIAPLSVIQQWMEDLRNKFSIEPVEITGRRLKNFVTEDSSVYLISYDLLKEHKEDFYKDWDLIIVDESHFIRNDKTSRFEAVKGLKSKFFLLLTATPMHNNVEDIRTQLSLFVPEEIISKERKREISKVNERKLFKTFIKRRLQKKELSEIIPDRKVLPPEIIKLSAKEKEIYEKLLEFLSQDSQYYQIISRSIKHIAPFIKQRYLEGFTSSKDAVIFALGNLRERIEKSIDRGYIEYNFGILKKEREGSAADEIRSFVEDELEAQSDIDIQRDDEGNLIVRLSVDEKIKDRLMKDIEFLNEIIKEIEKIDEFSKVKRVVELIEELKPSKEKKIVVFVGFIKTGEKLVKVLKDKGIKTEFFHGELEEAQRKKLIEKLWSRDEERIDVLVSTDAAYVGLNLQIADTVIHYDLSWNPMVVEQRVGRIHRIGQKRPITSYSFLCMDTIDERKHEILNGKLKEISTQLGMSYSVILSEVAISSEIGGLMAQFELKEIDEGILREGIEKHITKRKEIFELLEELPSEEAEILQVGFTNVLIKRVEEIIGEIIKFGRKAFNFGVQAIKEDQDFLILDYEKNGKRVRELSTLNEKALLSVKPESVEEWREKYKFENPEPSYLGLFHPMVRKVTDLLIEENSGKFWKKNVTDGKPIASLYLLVPLKIENPTVQLDTAMEVLVPVLYEIDKGEIEIDATRAYELACRGGKLEELSEDEKEILEEAKKRLMEKMDYIKGEIRGKIKNVKMGLEEIVLEKQRSENQGKIEGSTKKIENLYKERKRKCSNGLGYEKEMQEAKKLKEKLDELQKRSGKVPENSLTINFEEPRIAGGILVISQNLRREI